MTKLICICCPRGCHLTVDEKNGFAVTGNHCPKGEAYGKSQLQHPVRVVTSTVRLLHSEYSRLPVKTDRAIPKEKIFDCMDLIATLEISAPVHVGDILAQNILGTEANLVATKTIL